MTTPLLAVHDLSRRFGGVAAVEALSCDIHSGHVTALIGPNGAGKTTAINLIAGVLKPDRGDVQLEGRSLQGLKINERATLGIARTYQTPQMIPELSVLENVMTGGHRFGKYGFLDALWRPWIRGREDQALRARAQAALERVSLPSNYWNDAAESLAFGHQRRVEIARALAQAPKLILLDEPAAGLNPSETAEIARLLETLAAEGRGILLVEHDMAMVMSISAHIVVLNFGRKIAQGSPQEVSSNDEVVQAYLGVDDIEAARPTTTSATAGTRAASVGAIAAEGATASALLDIRHLRAGYGEVEVLHGLSLHVGAGEIVALIGANGAGKSTLLNVISGLVPARAGEVHCRAVLLGRTSAAKIARSGIRQVPEGRRVFRDLSVADNLMQGGYGMDEAAVRKSIADVYKLFPRLLERREQLAGTLSGGEQQMLAIGRALVGQPTVLMLDEPSMGLAPRIVAEIFQLIEQLRREWGVSILLVEQNARAALRISDRAYVMSLGTIVLEGTGAELLVDARVSDAFLGGMSAAGHGAISSAQPPP